MQPNIYNIVYARECNLLRDSSVRWFFGLNHPIWYSKYDSKIFLNSYYYLRTVKSGNFVTFFAQNIFFHKISWR